MEKVDIIIEESEVLEKAGTVMSVVATSSGTATAGTSVVIQGLIDSSALSEDSLVHQNMT